MGYAPIMFDLEKHGEEQLDSAVRRMPPGAMIILAKTGVGIRAQGGGQRRFMLRLPPRLGTRPEGIDQDAFKGAATATPELIKVHKQVLKSETPPEVPDDDL